MVPNDALSEIRGAIPVLSIDAKNRIRELLNNTISALSNDLEQLDRDIRSEAVAENRKVVRSTCEELRADLG